MLNVYIIHASSRLACRDIQRIQRIQRIQLYSYTRYTAYSTIQPPSVPELSERSWNAFWPPAFGDGRNAADLEPKPSRVF